MNGGSLLDYLGASVVVGDPEGKVIYVNRAFENCFLDGRDVVGVAFAELFEGGGREVILGAVAEVCRKSDDVHFRMRDGERGYHCVASPIDAGEGAVGVIIVFTNEPVAEQRLLGFYREMREPLEEVRAMLDELIDQTGGRRGERYRASVEKGIAALDLAQKWGDELYGLLVDESGPAEARASFDPVRVCRMVSARLASEFERAEVELEVVAPAQLPRAEGEDRHLETILARLLRDRLAQAQPGDRVSLIARRRSGSHEGLLVSVADAPALLLREAAEAHFVRDAIAALGGYQHTCLVSAAGRVTTIALAPGVQPQA